MSSSARWRRWSCLLLYRRRRPYEDRRATLEDISVSRRCSMGGNQVFDETADARGTIRDVAALMIDRL
jgi:hypothetical protein